MPKTNIVVLGAGVIGLTTALLLSRDERNSVTIIAAHMPGDYDSIEYASPWAGASYEPVGEPGSKAQQYERDTGPILFKLCREVKEAGIVFNQCTIYNRRKDADTPIGKWFANAVVDNPWFKDVVDDFRVLRKDELAEGIDSASTFQTVCINTTVYLAWLVGQCMKNGVVIKRGRVKHISEAGRKHHSGAKANIIVNCTGLSALKLGGVEDKKVYPARGQTVLVRQEPFKMTTISGTDEGPDEVVYTMTRAAGGGTILGGCLQANNWDAQVDLNLANRIMKRCANLVPELTQGKGYEALDVIRHGVGMRPMREGGPRVKAESIDGWNVVHQYGHGGGGYQMSWGSAQEAVKLVEQLRGQQSRL